MSKPIKSAAAVLVSAPVERAFAAALGFDAPSIVRPQGLLPGVRSVEGTTGAWNAPGETRRLTLTDGSMVEETLLDVRADSYRYRVAGFTGPFRFLVREAKGEFAVAPAPGGANLTWTYEFQPTSSLAAPIVSFIADVLWAPWMSAALGRLKAAIEAA